MSVEQWLLFALLIGIPLLQRLIRALRDRNSPHRAVSADPAPVIPAPPPPAVRHAVPQRPAPRGGARARRERQRAAATPTSVTQLWRPGRHGIALGAGDLRRAVVVMAILGPCRALHSSDALDPPGRG